MEDITNELLTNFEQEIPPQVDYPDQSKKVIRLARSFRDQSETILSLSKNRWYVDSSANLLDLADDLSTYPSIQAVGVVTERKLVGIVARKDLFDLLGRPFGRDVLHNETVTKVCQSPRSFLYNTNIYTVSEMLGDLQRSIEVRYYPICTDKSEFVGIFNSQDLLYFLSELTQKDISLSRSIQTRIVKESMSQENAAIEIISSSTMAKGVGGDFYHFRSYTDKRWLFCLCDVSGKGVAASMVTCTLWGAISGFNMRYGLARLIGHLNDFMLKTFEQDKFATGVFIDYHEDTRLMTIGDAGHGYAYLYRSGKLLRIKPANNAWPLGISSDMNIELYQYTLKKDDIILLVTDGLVEQPGKDEARYSMEPIQRILESHSKDSLSNLRLRILEDFHAFRGNSPLSDDLTFLMFRPR